MNSKELWDKLYNMETNEIKTQTMMMIMFLVKDRNVNVNDFIKDIKKIYKNLK